MEDTNYMDCWQHSALLTIHLYKKCMQVNHFIFTHPPMPKFDAHTMSKPHIDAYNLSEIMVSMHELTQLPMAKSVNYVDKYSLNEHRLRIKVFDMSLQ
jgi:hypothetical protein